MPPVVVVKVLDLVCRLLGQKQGWDNAKALMKDAGAFLTALKQYDMAQIDARVVARASVLLEDDSLNHATIAKASLAAAQLFDWANEVTRFGKEKHGIRDM